MLPTLIHRNARQILDSPFDRMFDRAGDGTESHGACGIYPVDIHEDANHIHVEAELPGFTKDQIELTLENGVLSISAQRDEQPKREGTTHLAQRRFTRINRRFTMPDSIDEKKVDATLKHGVLYLKLTKRDQVRPRKIEVK